MVRSGRRTDSYPLVAAAVAVITGCLLLAALGAPLRMPLMNLAALMIGLAVLAIIAIFRRAGLPSAAADAAFALLALAIPATLVFGVSLDGVSRWIVIAGVTVQPALIAAPALALGLALRPSNARAAACVIAAAGVALQPDPAAAAMLLLGTAAPLAVARANRASFAACAASAVALVVAVARTPPLPPVPFVEGIFAQALAAGALPAVLALVGTAAALSPAALLARRHPAAALAFAGAWGAAFAASLAGPYPTPILGFGGSAILGYMLCAGLLTPGAAAASSRLPRDAGAVDEDSNQTLRFA